MIQLGLQGVVISRVGATFPWDLPDWDAEQHKQLELNEAQKAVYKAWKAMWPELRGIEGSVNWVIGDWINFGKKKFGEKYAFALDATQWQYQRLRDAAWICAAVPLSSRYDNLDWTHHRVVASLAGPQQVAYLAQAAENQWSVSELRVTIRRAQATKKRSNAKVLGFVFAAAIAAPLRWLKQQEFDEWPQWKRDGLRKLLRPFVDVYNALEG